MQDNIRPIIPFSASYTPMEFFTTRNQIPNRTKDAIDVLKMFRVKAKQQNCEH